MTLTLLDSRLRKVFGPISKTSGEMQNKGCKHLCDAPGLTKELFEAKTRCCQGRKKQILTVTSPCEATILLHRLYRLSIRVVPIVIRHFKRGYGIAKNTPTKVATMLTYDDNV